MVKVDIIIDGIDKDHNLVKIGNYFEKYLVNDFEIPLDVSLRFGLARFNGNWYETPKIIIVYGMEIYLQLVEQKAFYERINNGLNVIFIHSSNVFKKEMRIYDCNYSLLNIIGSRFLKHPKECNFKLNLIKNKIINTGISDFEVMDELYIIEILDSSKIDVIAVSEYEEKKYPQIYTKKIGCGKICYIAPGHNLEAIANDNYKKIIKNTILWMNT
jgi:type 1 glutamine amidotransferase